MATRKCILGGRDKEVQAMTHNLKEQRMLQKTMQTLKLEETYVLKLVGLSHREMKVHQLRLKNKVDKIRSHLNADEIIEYKTLEADGKLEPLFTGAHLGNFSRIEAAEKRLKLGQGLSRTRSAPAPRVVSYPELTSSAPRPKTVAVSSLTSVNGTENGDKTGDKLKYPSLDHRPSTSHGFREISSVSPFVTRPKTAPSLERPSPESSQQEITSPNDQTNATKPLSSRSRPRTSRKSRSPRRLSILSESSWGSAKARKYAEECRLGLLEEEEVTALELEIRKDDFLDRVGNWVRESPSITANLQSITDSKHDHHHHHHHHHHASLKGKTAHAHNVTLKQKDEKHLTDAEENKESGTDWKELQKCRYLRISDSEMDLSGVKTLVKDQMRLFRPVGNARVHALSYTTPVS